MKSTSEKLQEIQQHGFELDLGNILNQAFENYKKVALTIGSLLLVLIILFTFLVGGAAAVTLGIGEITELATKTDITQYSKVAIVLNFVVTVIGTALIAPLTAGLLKMVDNAENGIPFGFSTAFSYYNSSYFKNLFIATLIIALFTNGVDAVVNVVIEFSRDTVLAGILKLVFGIFNGLIGLLTMFTIPLIIFGNLSAKEAIKGSLTMISKKFWSILLLMLIGAVCSIMFGLMAFCIGIFFTLPYMYSLQYTLYRNVMEIDNSNEEEIA